MLLQYGQKPHVLLLSDFQFFILPHFGHRNPAEIRILDVFVQAVFDRHFVLVYLAITIWLTFLERYARWVPAIKVLAYRNLKPRR